MSLLAPSQSMEFKGFILASWFLGDHTMIRPVVTFTDPRENEWIAVDGHTWQPGEAPDGWAWAERYYDPRPKTT